MSAPPPSWSPWTPHEHPDLRPTRRRDILGLAAHLPAGPQYAAVRAPIAEGGGYAWFANRRIGRPVADSLRSTMDWFRGWLAEAAPAGRPVILVGFSGGAAFAGGLVLDDPARYAGAAVLYGTLPFEAGLATDPGRLAHVPVFVADHGATPAGPRERVTWATLPGGRLPHRAGPPPEVSWTVPQQQESDNAPAHLQEQLLAKVRTLPGVVTASHACATSEGRQPPAAP